MSPNSSPLDLVEGLKYPGVIAEQASFALYARTGRPKPRDISKLIVSADNWREWLARNPQPAAAAMH